MNQLDLHVLTKIMDILLFIINAFSTGTKDLQYTYMPALYNTVERKHASLNCCKRLDPVTDIVMSI